MSSDQYGPPPPYPGYGSAVPPDAPTYNDPSKPFSGYSNPSQPGMGYSAQPMGYPPQYSQQAGGAHPTYTHNTAVVVTQPAVHLVQTFRHVPVHCNCPHCRAEIVTATHFETGTFTWVMCIILWLVGCALGCCFIPFCMDSAKDVIHTCPSCNQQIARYSRM